MEVDTRLAFKHMLISEDNNATHLEHPQVISYFRTVISEAGMEG